MAEHLNNELMFHVLGYISPSVNSNLEELLGECVTEYGFSKDDCLDILQEFENRYGGYDEVIKEFRSKYYNYDAEEFEAPQATINPQWAMNIIQSQYDNVGIDRVLSVREDFEGDLDITILLTNGNKQQFLIEKSMIGLIYDEDNDEYVRMEAEFSPADEMALRNYIDLPPAGMGDVKGRRYRKWEHKQKGILPKQKSIGEMRRKVVDELPKGFKMAQFGLLALFGGLVYRGMTKEE